MRIRKALAAGALLTATAVAVPVAAASSANAVMTRNAFACYGFGTGALSGREGGPTGPTGQPSATQLNTPNGAGTVWQISKTTTYTASSPCAIAHRRKLPSPMRMASDATAIVP